MKPKWRERIWSAAVSVAIIAVSGGAGCYNWMRRDRLKAECRDRGGHVVEIENGFGWFCMDWKP